MLAVVWRSVNPCPERAAPRCWQISTGGSSTHVVEFAEVGVDTESLDKPRATRSRGRDGWHTPCRAGTVLQPSANAGGGAARHVPGKATGAAGVGSRRVAERCSRFVWRGLSRDMPRLHR